MSYANAPWRWAALAVLASLWGLHEAFVDETLVCRAAALLLLAAGRGLDGVLQHTLTSGVAAALIGLVAVPLGLRLGRGLVSRATRRPGRAFATATTACALLWVVAALVR